MKIKPIIYIATQLVLAPLNNFICECFVDVEYKKLYVLIEIEGL